MEAVITIVDATTDPVILIPEETSRMSAGIFNNSNKKLYLKYGLDPSVDSFTLKMYPQQFFNVFENYTGVVSGFWEAGATGQAMVTELYATHEQATDGEVG